MAEEFAGYMQRDLDRATAELALAGASGIVRGFCRWGLTREPAAVMTIDGNGSRVLNLPTLRLNAVESVTVEGTALDAAGYVWSAGGQLYRDAGWPIGFRSVTAVVDHGYDTIPDDVRIVVCSLAARYYSNPERLRSKTVGATASTFTIDAAGHELSELEMTLIAGYRLP